MRDIRNDLKERLAAAEADKAESVERLELERQKLEQRFKSHMAELDSAMHAIRIMLDMEARRVSRSEGTLQIAPTLPLRDFLVQKVREQAGILKTHLRDLADQAGYFREGENPGRATHGHLLNLVQAGTLFVSGDQYFLPPTPPETAGDATTGDSAGDRSETAVTNELAAASLFNN